MTDHFKTIETNTEPTFIITNDLGDMPEPQKGAILIGHHWFDGTENGVAPKINMDTDGVIYMDRTDIEKLIEALREFL